MLIHRAKEKCTTLHWLSLTWDGGSDCHFVKFCQMSQEILTIGDNVLLIMTIEKYSLLMIAHCSEAICEQFHHYTILLIHNSEVWCTLFVHNSYFRADS